MAQVVKGLLALTLFFNILRHLDWQNVVFIREYNYIFINYRRHYCKGKLEIYEWHSNNQFRPKAPPGTPPHSGQKIEKFAN